MLAFPVAAHYAAIAFAIIGSGLWFWSALVRLPKEFTVGWGGVGGTSEDMLNALKRQSRLNAWAAAFTAAAIISELFAPH